nr:chorismate-binding protein [Propionibacterium acidifaciens]
MKDVAPDSTLTPRLAAASDDWAGLDSAQWLGAALDLVPDDVERPWAWVAPNGGPAVLGWGETARFGASGAGPVASAWRRFRDWARGHWNGADDPTAPGAQGPVALGSFPFDPSEAGSFVVPGVTLTRAAAGAPTRIIAADGAPEPSPRGRGRRARPRLTISAAPGAERSWVRAVDALRAVLADPERAEEKVVLARAVDACADRPLDQTGVLDWLARRFTGCWVYADDGLVGATPELLVDVHEGVFRCRILAGTRKPGWARELLTDPKEQHEHALAVASVTAHLERAGLSEPRLRGPYLLELPNVAHLATDITARVGPGRSAADVADVLYPTAAICGTPRAEAFARIMAVEHLDRGRFSGPVGWMGVDGSGQWGLALRCAQFSPGSRRARLFAGAGILPDSRAELEWDETDSKMAPMRRALAHG